MTIFINLFNRFTAWWLQRQARKIARSVHVTGVSTQDKPGSISIYDVMRDKNKHP